MSCPRQFDDRRRRQIYQYIERNGVVEPETVRRNVLVTPETGSKPARSRAALEGTVPIPHDEFVRHLAALERDGYLQEADNRYRVALTDDSEETVLDIDGETGRVRPAREEDTGEIIDVIETVAAVDTHVVARRLAETVDHDGVLLRHNEREDRVFFVATVEDAIVGWLHVRGERFPAMDHVGELTLGVLEQYRGNGLGGTLMDRGIEWARRQGYRKLYQSLPATNERARSFLETQGWSVEATREGHYRLHDELVDEVQLARWLE